MPSEPDERTADSRERVPLKRILAFFVPLGLSASLVSLSHVIINGTLARSEAPEAVIAAYTIAMSIFIITERPAVFLRQTCSALAADRTAFRAVGRVTALILFFTLAFGLVVSYTPAGRILFTSLYNADETLLGRVLDSYRILIFVTIFSAVRCLYHGIIIRNMQTKWLTIGMLVRLCVMYLISLFFILGPYGIDGRAGAVIFLSGMLVEAVVSYFEGRRILRGMPEKLAQSTVRKAKDVLPFYRPLVVTSFISVVIGPAINAMLGKTADIELAIASYAVALSITNIVVSFYTYVHQIVLNFYRTDPAAVRSFTLLFNLLPAAAIAVIAYTPVGPPVVGGVIGSEGALLDESLRVLRVFVLFAALFPWVDYGNGLVMLNKRTRYMAFSQLGNVGMTLLALVVAVAAAPSWNGLVGALAQSSGLVGELLVLIVLLRRFEKRSPQIAGQISP